MKLSHYIFLGFLFILLLFSITTYINFRLSEDVTENAEYFSKSTSITKNSTRLQRNILTMVNGLRGYLLTEENSFIESYESAKSENDSIIKELGMLMIDSSQSDLLREIRQLKDEWTEEYTDPLKEAKMISDKSPGNLKEFKEFYSQNYGTETEKGVLNRLLVLLREFTNNEYELRDVRKARLNESISLTRTTSFILTAASVIIALVIIVFLVTKISRRIKEMSDMADSISRGNYDSTITDIGKDELSSLGNSLNHMASELKKNISLLQQSNKELDQFAHIVSHDMKGPLRGISNVVTWIEEDHKTDLIPKVKEYLDLIKGRISRAENLIEGLLSYARADKNIFEKENIDLNLLIDEVVENLPNDKKTRMDIAVLPQVYSERILLFQIFSNLISNAIKYNDKEERVVQIYYEEAGNNKYEFFIKDNGIGIAKNYYDRIFVVFQTLTDRDSFESTGVGLAIVKKILDSKNETIRLVSEPGKGSVFSFTWSKK